VQQYHAVDGAHASWCFCALSTIRSLCARCTNFCRPVILRFRWPYFGVCLLAYQSALLFGFSVFEYFDRAQPMLLYINPMVACAIVAMAWQRDEIDLLWNATRGECESDRYDIQGGMEGANTDFDDPRELLQRDGTVIWSSDPEIELTPSDDRTSDNAHPARTDDAVVVEMDAVRNSQPPSTRIEVVIRHPAVHPMESPTDGAQISVMPVGAALDHPVISPASSFRIAPVVMMLMPPPPTLATRTREERRQRRAQRWADVMGKDDEDVRVTPVDETATSPSVSPPTASKEPSTVEIGAGSAPASTCADANSAEEEFGDFLAAAPINTSAESTDIRVHAHTTDDTHPNHTGDEAAAQ
jgi:hypothetical protein